LHYAPNELSTDGTVQSADEVILQAGDCVAIKPGFSTPADADFTAEIKTQPVPQFTYYLYDHLGNTRVTYSVEVKAADDVDYTVQSATDYYPYGKALHTYGKERYQSTYHERDVESGFDYRGARFYDGDVGRFNSLDPLAHKYPQLSDYVYVAGNPVIYIDPDGQEIAVTTSGGKELFRLDDGNEEVTTLTAKEAYDRGIQWFEATAENYMPLTSTAENLGTFSELKHFTWDEVAQFAEVDRSMISYRTGGAGDWKADGKPGDGYFLVTVDGEPYWGDAIGQIPFAVDKFTDDLESTGSVESARESTIATGQRFGDGSLLGGESDDSNSYDNAMIRRAISWAAKRYIIVDSPCKKSENYTIERAEYPASNLSLQSHENQ